ncbi:MAG: Allantoicase [Geoglossum umbratile]|nr:MAG: Allantoicase [Geoglossum umbratile]
MNVQVPLRSGVDDKSGLIRLVKPEDIQATFGSKCIDLVSGPLGAAVLSFSDEFFASAINLITPTPPIQKVGVYTPNGAWYDGWETRRHNPNSFDYVTIKFGVASGQILGVEIDTGFFNGNHAPAAAVEACVYQNAGDELADPSKDSTVEWDLILPIQPCGPSARHAWRLPQTTEKAYTHARLLMYPDGGIARFRLYGIAQPVFPPGLDTVLDLASLQNGGRVIAFSDQHYGTASNLLLPGRGVDMGDGWETKRSRREGHIDWAIIRLGARGTISKLIVDTAHFIGNFPQAITVKACDFMGGGEGEQPDRKVDAWVEILGPQKCRAHYEHVFEGDALTESGKAWTHVMLTMVPDGGVKRFRVFGTRAV